MRAFVFLTLLNLAIVGACGAVPRLAIIAEGNAVAFGDTLTANLSQGNLCELVTRTNLERLANAQNAWQTPVSLLDIRTTVDGPELRAFETSLNTLLAHRAVQEWISKSKTP